MGKQKTTEQFIKESKTIHGDKYDYSKTVYNKAQKKVIITCHLTDKNGNEHGDFEQTPNSHLCGRGCPKCGLAAAGEKISQQRSKTKKKKRNKKHLTFDNFKELFNEIHKGKYYYDKSIYTNNKTKMVITCPEHGDFLMTPTNHYYGKQGCPECARLNRIKAHEKDKDYFVQKASIVHSNFYSYDKVVYKRARKKVIITCPVHGDFEQSPDNHLKGCGCPNCQNSQLERKVRCFLINNEINFLPQYRPKWLATDKAHSQSIDFYLPEYKIAIECHGIQHFKYAGAFGNTTIEPEKFFKKICDLDDRKYNLCKKHGIKILYFTDCNIDKYRYSLFKDLNELLLNIKNK